MVAYQLGYGENKYDPKGLSAQKMSVGGRSAGEGKGEQGRGGGRGAGVKGEKLPPQWFDMEDDKNTHVYVSNLPLDIDEEQFVAFMSKCGLVQKDPTSGAWKVKLYRNEGGGGGLKGDGVCCYIKIDSVRLALQILDQSYFKENLVTVERAKFQMKGSFDPGRKPKSKKKRDKIKIQKMQEKLFSWKPEKLKGEKGKHERIVVVKQAFRPEDFNEDVGVILELKDDFKEEAGKFGTVRKVDLFDNNTEGALKIHMSSPEEADAVVSNFNGRFFGGRRLESYIWDGKEKLHVVETEAEKEKRLQRWEKYVEDDDEQGAGSSSKRMKLVGGDVTPPRKEGEPGGAEGSGGNTVDSDDEKFFDEED